MADNRHPHEEARHDLAPNEMVNAGVRHEDVDVNVVAITKFGIAFFLVLIVMIFAVWGVFSYLKAREAAAEIPAAPYPQPEVHRLPPEPRLETTPRLDLGEVRAAEDKILNTYGWADQSKGLVRIPVDRAIDILAQKGLPSRKENGPITKSDPRLGTPTESGLGPAIQQVGGPLASEIHVPPVQPLAIRGDGSSESGRQAGGPPTPLSESPGMSAPETPRPAGTGSKQ